mgnify:CR=1 FL=1
MAKERTKVIYKGAHMGGFYFLTYVGTLVHFLNNADGAGEVLLSFLQALVWPALLIYRIFQLLNI